MAARMRAGALRYSGRIVSATSERSTVAVPVVSVTVTYITPLPAAR